ncbi:hypothetical protein T492DRAFT_851382 [Pavlovales sp. CCMP2436]|nr:hypothetical protein T492DRAFT_851382 [Pavlovales sp. CCMP2436]
MWENYRGRLEAVTLATAVYIFGGAGSDIQSYIEHAACSAIGISNFIHVNSELFQNVPGFSGEYMFNNGLFNLYEHTFVPLREYICTPNSCAKKQYPVDFDPDWLCPDAVHPTPQLDSIVRMQEWDSAEKELLLGMLGRLLFPVGRYDNWQACLMLIGVGGYSPEQIGYMSNTIEKNFPFESLVNSSVVIAADVDKDLMSNLSQTKLHKIINGEGRRTLQWVAPFMLVANVVPNWQDDQGQMTRRVVYFNFSKKPTLCNSNLAAELKDPAVQVQILLRCSKVYRRLAVRYKQDAIMPNILAKYYPRRAEVGSKVQQDNDPLVHFVAEVLVHSPGQEHKIRFCELHEYDPKLVQFRTEFQNIVSAKDMKVYTSMLEIAQSNRVKSGQSVPKSAFIEKYSINAFAIMDDEY